MTKEEANIKAKEIFQEWLIQKDKIIETAQREGKLKMGLDANNDLFKELDQAIKQKLNALKSMISD